MDLQMVDIAFASGFGSLRRFNDAFKGKYHLTPTQFRRQISKDRQECAKIRVSVGYRPPYRWDEMLSFLKERAIPGVEVVGGDTYYRTVRVPNAEQALITGWISVSDNADKNVLEVGFSESLFPVLPQVLGKVRNMFDLYCDPETVYRALSPLNEIREELCIKGTRLPGCFDPFELSVRAILGQQVTVKAAGTLTGRIVSRFGTHVKTPVEGLTHAFPTVESLLNLGENIEDYLGPLGVIAGRARAIRDLAQAVTDGEICFDKCHEPKAEIKKLTAIKGIGAWTANYIAMRAYSWTDAFLETDAGIRHALSGRSPKELRAMSEGWRPWRSYAAINLWNSLTR